MKIILKFNMIFFNLSGGLLSQHVSAIIITDKFSSDVVI